MHHTMNRCKSILNCIKFEVEANKKYYFILVVYNPPRNNKMEFLARLEETLECLSKKTAALSFVVNSISTF